MAPASGFSRRVTQKHFLTDPQLHDPALFARRQRQAGTECILWTKGTAPEGGVSSSVAELHCRVFKRTSHQQMNAHLISISNDAHCDVQVRHVRNPDLSNGIPILAKALGLSRRKKRKIRLVVRIHTGH
jgi:hypothetical protein